jgi:hypothetical protein
MYGLWWGSRKQRRTIWRPGHRWMIIKLILRL